MVGRRRGLKGKGREEGRQGKAREAREGVEIRVSFWGEPRVSEGGVKRKREAGES